jgi:hypothetical protein
MPDFFKDEKGRVVGFSTTLGSVKTYSDSAGKVVSRIHDNRTYDSKGSFKGFGDQGLRLFGDKKKP